jgi:hypothetical protein
MLLVLPLGLVLAWLEIEYIRVAHARLALSWSAFQATRARAFLPVAQFTPTARKIWEGMGLGKKGPVSVQCTDRGRGTSCYAWRRLRNLEWGSLLHPRHRYEPKVSEKCSFSFSP